MRSINASVKRGLVARFRQTARSLIAPSAPSASRSSSSSDAPLSAALPRITVRFASAVGIRPIAAALSSGRCRPKPPAMYSVSICPSETPASCDSACMPAAMAALASCSCRISRGVSATVGVSSSASSSAAPVSSMPPLSSSAAAASIRPEPQTERASPSPITCTASPPPAYATRSIAPSTLADPQLMPPPSKAGPAAVAQQYSVPLCQSAISPFVPRSMSIEVAWVAVMPLASTAQATSAPTNAPRHGG